MALFIGGAIATILLILTFHTIYQAGFQSGYKKGLKGVKKNAGKK